MKAILIDCFDSFTYMLQDYVLQCGIECECFRYDQFTVENLLTIKADIFIFSPGPGSPNDYPLLHDLLKKAENTHAFLGICLGHQIIAEFYGSTIQHAIAPRHGKVHELTHMNDALFNEIPSPFKATRYHSLIVEKLSAPLTPIAWDNSEIMAFKHIQKPMIGLQFHPESCCSEYGKKILLNYFNSLV